MNEQVVDARGRSCPEPALLTRQALASAGGQGPVIVLVDSASSRDNVERTARLAGWLASVETQSEGCYRLTLHR
jgi:tRNA 2-thiouridine synthesizing protein A